MPKRITKKEAKRKVIEIADDANAKMEQILAGRQTNKLDIEEVTQLAIRLNYVLEIAGAQLDDLAETVEQALFEESQEDSD
jgi:hypothetical protein